MHCCFYCLCRHLRVGTGSAASLAAYGAPRQAVSRVCGQVSPWKRPQPPLVAPLGRDLLARSNVGKPLPGHPEREEEFQGPLNMQRESFTWRGSCQGEPRLPLGLESVCTREGTPNEVSAPSDPSQIGKRLEAWAVPAPAHLPSSRRIWGPARMPSSPGCPARQRLSRE